MTKPSKPGNTLVELGLLLSLVSLLGIAALQLLGKSSSQNIATVDNNQTALMKLASMDFSSEGPHLSQGNVSLNGPGYYRLVMDPDTGQPRMESSSLQHGNSVTNATSIDGNEWNILGSLHIADSLEELAARQTNPRARTYLLAQARDIYYMGAAQGEIDSIPSLELRDGYTHLDALKDIQRFQGQLMLRIESPPAGMDSATYFNAMALTTDAYNIGQSYINSLRYYLDNNINFDEPATQAGGEVGAGLPGDALKLADQMNEIGEGANDPLANHAEQVYDYQTLQATAAEILSDNKVDSAPVEAAFSDAVLLHKMGSN